MSPHARTPAKDRCDNNVRTAYNAGRGKAYRVYVRTKMFTGDEGKLLVLLRGDVMSSRSARCEQTCFDSSTGRACMVW
jgi:hypothetical protein